ncbi:DUF6252 family protein [Flavobacterium hauense]
MKILRALSFTLAVLALNSCSGDDSSPVDNPDNDTQYAMTAKINGTLTNLASPFGGNEASSGGFTQFPDEEYLHLQGWPVGEGIGAREITMYISRANLTPGTYQVNTPSNEEAVNYIDLIDNTNGDEFEDTVEGSITITEVNTTAKTVKGTFTFKTSDDAWETNPVINFNITEGTFNYKYDVED